MAFVGLDLVLKGKFLVTQAACVQNPAFSASDYTAL